MNDNNVGGLKVYMTYMAIKNHFTLDKYDYFRYNGRVKADMQSFMAKRERLMFNKLYYVKDYESVILANVLKDPKVWIGSIIEPSEGGAVYNEWRKRVDRITHNFSSEIQELNDENFMHNFKVDGGRTPTVVRLAQQKKISIETLSILINVTNTGPYMVSKMNDEFVAAPVVKKAMKYHGFLKYDEKKIESALLRSFEI